MKINSVLDLICYIIKMKMHVSRVSALSKIQDNYAYAGISYPISYEDTAKYEDMHKLCIHFDEINDNTYESKQLILPCSALSSCKASSDIKVIGICMRTHLFTYNSFYYLVSMTLRNSQTLLHDWTDESMLFANFI